MNDLDLLFEDNWLEFKKAEMIDPAPESVFIDHEAWDEFFAGDWEIDNNNEQLPPAPVEICHVI